MNRPRNTVPAILIALLLMAIPAAASAAPVVHPVDQSASTVRDYWTKARMRAAEPVPATPAGRPAPGVGTGRVADPNSSTYVPAAAPGSDSSAELLNGSAVGATGAARAATSQQVPDPSAVGIRAHGKVFFTITKGSDPGDFVCSGTAINSRNRSVVLTAGHCVFDSQTAGGKATNWTFVPAYLGGAAPYGEWPAKKLATTKQWKTEANLRYDLGVGVVYRDSSGRQLQSVVGARGVGFDQPREQNYDIFGYPAVEPFTGELEYLCSSGSLGSDAPGGQGPKTMAASCDMTGGASGGGWIADNTLLSVTSYGYRGTPVLYGPYLSTTAKTLYKKARGKR